MAETRAKERIEKERKRNPELVKEKEKAHKKYQQAEAESAGKVYQEEVEVPVRKTEGGKYGSPSSDLLRGAGPSDYKINDALERAGAK